MTTSVNVYIDYATLAIVLE